MYVTPATAAIMVEGIQGEGGVTPASAEYLVGLRRLCDERKLRSPLKDVDKVIAERRAEAR